MAKVLVVDDEESIRYSYQRFLSDAGYDVTLASGLHDAQSSLGGDNFEVAIVDRILGDGNGLELIKRIREVQPFCEPILISGNPSFESASETFQYEVFAYLSKPVVKKTLCQMVQDAAQKNKRRRESCHHERILQFLFDSSPNAIVISDLSGRTRFVNPSFTRIFGYSKEELIGKTIPYIPEWDKQKSESERINLVHLKDLMERESQRLRKDGKSIDVSITQSLCRDHKGDPTDILTVIREITDKKRIEKQLWHAQKTEAIGTLAGGIAHDFNNLLFIISGYAEMSLKELPEGNRVINNLAQISKAVTRARSLVQQILTFSRLEEQGQKKTLIQPVVKETLVMLRSSLPSTIEIYQEIDESCKSVLADPTRIHQVIMNLCTNAYHSMRKNGGRLEVTLNRITIGSEDTAAQINLTPGKYVRLTVSDTGHGIEASLMDRIFEPYFTTKTQWEGTGMGLAMVHGIVKSIGGHITVSSKPKKGSKFNVYLPEIDEAVVEVETPSTGTVQGGNEHILLIDDEQEIIEMLEKMLAYFGYQVTIKSSSEEALKLFCSDPNHFDLVITDQTMPKMTGVELTQKIREIRPDIPVILCTGFSEMITEEKLKALGVKEYIMKPIHCKEMAGIIRNVLDERCMEMTVP